jgi:pimeloyl-ACP methyl ester carboxylesterase
VARGLVAAAVLALALPAGAAAQYAPLDRPGPALTPKSEDLAKALVCSGSLQGATRDPVLLLAGTTVTSEQNFSWNYEPALAAEHTPFCALDQPAPLDQNMGDIQLRGEYVVHAVREMARRSGRRVAVFGHSQGGMVTRWALRFWPDTRALVSDLVGAAPSNHGTVVAVGDCLQACPPSNWQQRSDARFIEALNSGQETFPGIDYTAIRTNFDEVVVPTTGTALAGPARVTNVAVQDICPADSSDHLNVGTADAVTWALFKDAIDHDGPADPARIDGSVCTHPFMPGVNPATYLTDAGLAYTALAVQLATYPTVEAEPPLACYVMAVSTCPAPAAAAGSTAATKCRLTIRISRRWRAVRVTLRGHRLTVRHRRVRRSVRRTDTVRVVIRARTRAGKRFTLRRAYRACKLRR